MPEATPNPIDIDDLLQRLTLDEKASLTAGASLWFVPPVERLGIPSLKVSDGPSGVRGESLTGRRSLSLPCGMAIGSTWNPALVESMGEVLAAEARSKGVNVLLGPTVCIPRTPLAGRTFESYSEDPHLTARIAVAYVQGVQRHGVACCIKHFACNDQEHERMTISAEVDERALREIHLVAFEAAVREANVWSVMTAYNKVNGVYCCEQPELLGRILRDEWGFDGLVMSDWFGTHSTGPAAEAGLDLEMPGPSAWLGPTLAAAVRDGAVAESVLDVQVRHMLGLMERVGILDRRYLRGPEREEDRSEHRAIARAVTTEGTVLLVNDGLLPLLPLPGPASSSSPSSGAGISRVAVIGPNAVQMAMGGGSSEVTPHRRRGLVEALAERLPGVTVSYDVGCRIDRGLPSMDMALVAAGDEVGSFTLEYFDSTDLSGTPVHVEPARLSRIMWLGQPHENLTIGSYSIRLTGTFTPDLSGPWRLGLESAGRSVLRLDGAVVVDNSHPRPGDGFYGAGSTLVEVERTLENGRPYALQVDIWPRSQSSPLIGVRIAAGRPDAPDEFERAVAAARRRRCCRGGGRIQQPVGVRRSGPSGPLVAGSPARTGRGRDQGQSTHGGRGQCGLAGGNAVGGRRWSSAPPLVRRRGSRRRPGRHHRGCGRAERSTADHLSSPRRGRPDRERRRALSGRRRTSPLRRRRVRGVSLL